MLHGQVAEEGAKAKRAKIWKDYTGEKEVKPAPEDDSAAAPERRTHYTAVVVTEVTPELHFYAQKVDQGPALEQLMAQLRQELDANPPLIGAYTPKKGTRPLFHFFVMEGDETIGPLSN